MLKVQYLSDLHLERVLNSDFFYKNPIPKIGDILILAGDITKISKIHYSDSFFDDISEKFDEVFMIPGNHEYYSITELDLINKPYINRKIRDNVTLLNNQNIIYKGINFIFSTMWTDVSIDKQFQVQDGMMDYRYIKNIDAINNRLLVSHTNKIFQDSFEFIMNSVKENKEDKVFITTHHAPTKLVISQKYKTNSIAEGFSVELHPFIFDSKIDFWLYGHTHESIDAEINNTKIISNQFGYVFSGTDIIFKHKIIEL